MSATKYFHPFTFLVVLLSTFLTGIAIAGHPVDLNNPASAQAVISALISAMAVAWSQANSNGGEATTDVPTPNGNGQ
jgi:hypothetical protein